MWLENGLDTFSDIDDEEIDCYIYKAPEDKATKSKLWHHFNKDWLEEKAQKEQQLRVPASPPTLPSLPPHYSHAIGVARVREDAAAVTEADGDDDSG